MLKLELTASSILDGLVFGRAKRVMCGVQVCDFKKQGLEFKP